MSTRDSLGGIIHTYQKYDPAEFPSPTTPPPDLVSPAFDHLMTYGNMRRLTPEELANAVHIDPSQIRGFGPSIEALRQILEEQEYLRQADEPKRQPPASCASSGGGDPVGAAPGGVSRVRIWRIANMRSAGTGPISRSTSASAEEMSVQRDRRIRASGNP